MDTYTDQAELPADVLAKGDGENEAIGDFVASVLDEMLQDSDQLTEEDGERQLPPGAPKVKGLLNSGRLHAIVKAIDSRYPELSEKGIEWLLRDVFVYVRVKFVQEGIDEIDEKTLTTLPTVIVGHSLGTVVGYNVIRNNRTNIDLEKYITLGSPLEIKAIAATLGVPENTADEGW
ncbi:hypothetical protein [Ruegeria sp. Alg231-54]|uniref:hypothetical protein n=1 Tax=Ruegeria sp. Alg231-54 TaxID=1922221 RepID=UPI000D55660D|nr:hypothetical protein [Ruegeria sp. Alg231-54]